MRLNHINSDVAQKYELLKKTADPRKSGWTVDQVIEASMPVILQFANKYQTSTIPADELIGGGMAGVAKAYQEFDSGYGFGAKFATYAWNWIRSGVQRAAEDIKKLKEPASRAYYEPDNSDLDDIEDSNRSHRPLES